MINLLVQTLFAKVKYRKGVVLCLSKNRGNKMKSFFYLMFIFNTVFAGICWDDSTSGYEDDPIVIKNKNNSEITYYFNRNLFVTYFLNGPLSGKFLGVSPFDLNQENLRNLYNSLRSKYKEQKKINEIKNKL